MMTRSSGIICMEPNDGAAAPSLSLG